MLTHDEIIASVQNAFLPLCCDAKIWDFDAKLRFKISENGQHVVRMDEVAMDYAQDEELLASVLNIVRTRIQSKGYVLQSSSGAEE
jgi:hypothetical protein